MQPGVPIFTIIRMSRIPGKYFLKILKTEWLYKMKIATREECSSVLERIINFYNNERPHMSIGMQTPEMAHTQLGEQRKCWKNYYNTN